MAGLPLIPQVFNILTGLVEDRSGLHYGPEDRELLAEKISPRALEAGFESLLDYYYYQRYDPRGPAELDALVEALCVHESYLFREADALRVAVDELVAPAVRAGRRPRLWCAAAAQGEEPVTLAVLLAERDLLDRVELVASDISERALARARRGVFTGRALRALPAGEHARWLRREGERVVAAPELVEAVRWKRLNLVDEAAVRALAPLDLVLCRNVIIYFADETVRKVASTFAEVLAPGGWVLVGASESLLRFGTSLRCEERRGVFVYRGSP
jgi:chemotaxis protein methyltransferase CheR